MMVVSHLGLNQLKLWIYEVQGAPKRKKSFSLRRKAQAEGVEFLYARRTILLNSLKINCKIYLILKAT